MVGVFGMLCRFTLVPGAVSLVGQEKHLTRADVRVDEACYSLRLRVAFSKTNQFQAKVHEVCIVGAPRPAAPLDPVRLWRARTRRRPPLAGPG